MNSFLVAACLLVNMRQPVFSGTTIYTDYFGLEAASSGFPGDRVNVSFRDFPVNGIYWPPLTVSNIALLGRVFVVEPVSGVQFLYLNNYDSDVPLTIHFPTGAKAFGAFFSSWLGPTYPKTITMTATTDQGEVFTFDAFSCDPGKPPINVSWFGLLPEATIYNLTFSDGAIFGAAGPYPMHEEMIAEIFAVINKPPTLDLSAFPNNQVNVGVNGAAGQTVVLLTSTNLATWQPVVTNKLTSDRWVYSGIQTNSTTARFYRVTAN